jgi:tRNA(Met) C34 N-acetyltransferase TmcA
MTYETVCDAVVMATKKLIYEGKLNYLDESEAVLLISKVLQGLPWQSVAEILRSSKLKVAETLRGVITKVIEVLYSSRTV